MDEISAFTIEQVSRLTSISVRQLVYWDRTEFYSPRFRAERGRQPFGRVYSFRDLVALRVISLLRNEHSVPLQELRKVGAWLRARYDAPWSSLRFYVSARRIFFDDPKTGARVATCPAGQVVFPIEMEPIAQETRRDVQQLSRRRPEDIGNIVRHRYVVHNSPVVAGTRIPTSAIWNFHCAGYDSRAIMREYPTLSGEDITAAISYEEGKRRRRAG